MEEIDLNFLKKDKSGNASNGRFYSYGASQCMAYTSKPIIAMGEGISDLMVIETDDALVILHQDHAEEDLAKMVSDLDPRSS